MKKNILIAIFVLVTLLILAYGLMMNRVGFTTDEWLTLFDVENKGPASLVRHYEIDRPLRGYYYKYMTIALGTKMLHYQLAGLAIRLLDSAVFLLILMILFPKRFSENLIASALTLIFPGFLQQPNAYDYQAQFASHLAMIGSFLICILPIYFQKKWMYFIAIPLSIGLFQVSVGIMELYVGMEVFRYYLIYLVLKRYSSPKPPLIRKVILNSIPYLLSTLAFVIWRVFIFETKRVTVDTGSMLAQFSGIDGILGLIGSWLINFYRLTVAAWYEPLINFGYFSGSGRLLPVLLFGVAVGLIVLVLYRSHSPRPEEDGDSFALPVIIGGLILALGSLVPVVFGGREIILADSTNRFSFPGMMGSVLIVVGLLSYLRLKFRYVVLSGLLLTSLLVHYGNSLEYAKNYEAVRTTWWQFSWRVPDIAPRTVLTGYLEDGRLNESPTIWAPVNIIYYPDRKYVIAGAEVLNDQTVAWIHEQAVVPQVKRLNGWDNDFNQLLVFNRPDGSCLQIIDGKHPEITQSSSAHIVEIASYSRIERIDPLAEKTLDLNPDLFGPEPEHGWCYFYQKAQLARQAGDWDLVAQLGDEVISQGLNTTDKIEWIVFTQGLAYLESANYAGGLEELLSDDYAGDQACDVFRKYSDPLAGSQFQARHEILLDEVCP